MPPSAFENLPCLRKGGPSEDGSGRDYRRGSSSTPLLPFSPSPLLLGGTKRGGGYHTRWPQYFTFVLGFAYGATGTGYNMNRTGAGREDQPSSIRSSNDFAGFVCAAPL